MQAALGKTILSRATGSDSILVELVDDTSDSTGPLQIYIYSPVKETRGISV